MSSLQRMDLTNMLFTQQSKKDLNFIPNFESFNISQYPNLKFEDPKLNFIPNVESFNISQYPNLKFKDQNLNFIPKP
ncbi:hypothetical protein FRX31_010124 [Thalictrum thalictroides]|uniref:Uncharacterized protein n=1 Tax=Thalictrum thalictroides TaxID=46969 RepID=A0A7J6WSD3_THATH|nr:hypothetical protein FRX31_010124 [Thalictrum thalictroides]